MPEPTSPNDPMPPAPADAADDTRRAELEKLPKRELVEQVLAFRDSADRYAARIDELIADRGRRRPGGRPEDAFAVTALLDLHRTVEERQGATIRGRSPALGNRYLEAARALGDELVEAILGPATKA